MRDAAKSLGEEAAYIPNGLDGDEFKMDIEPEGRDQKHIRMLYHDAEWKGSADGLKALITVRLGFSFNETIALRGSELFGLFDALLFIIPLKYLKLAPVRAAYGLFLLALGAKFYASALAFVGPYRWIFG